MIKTIVGLSVSGKTPMNEHTFSQMKNDGIDAVEISFGKYSDFDFLSAKKGSEYSGIKLWSFHLPFMPFADIDISSKDKTVRDTTLSIHKSLIAKGSEIGIDKFIIHPSGEPINENEREERMKYSAESLDFLAEYAYRNGAVLAVENLPRSCIGRNSSEIIHLINTNDKLRVCFDVNHLLSETSDNFFDTVGKKIITLHISDYDFIDEKHWLPGEGNINWKSIMDGLKRIEYNGAFVYEVDFSPRKNANDKPLCYIDFKNNSKWLFDL